MIQLPKKKSCIDLQPNLKKKKKKANLVSTVNKISFGPQTEDDLKALSKKVVVHLFITN